MVLDCRFLPNPFWVPELRPLSGLDEPVRDHVLGQDAADEFLGRLRPLLETLVPAYSREGKAYLSLAFGCTGGRHRSVAIAEAVGSTGMGWLQVISDFDDLDDEFAMLRRLVHKAHRPMTLTVLQRDAKPEAWRQVMDHVASANRDGLKITGQVIGRPMELRIMQPCPAPMQMRMSSTRPARALLGRSGSAMLSTRCASRPMVSGVAVISGWRPAAAPSMPTRYGRVSSWAASASASCSRVSSVVRSAPSSCGGITNDLRWSSWRYSSGVNGSMRAR